MQSCMPWVQASASIYPSNGIFKLISATAFIKYCGTTPYFCTPTPLANYCRKWFSKYITTGHQFFMPLGDEMCTQLVFCLFFCHTYIHVGTWCKSHLYTAYFFQKGNPIFAIGRCQRELQLHALENFPF